MRRALLLPLCSKVSFNRPFWLDCWALSTYLLCYFLGEQVAGESGQTADYLHTQQMGKVEDLIVVVQASP